MLLHEEKEQFHSLHVGPIWYSWEDEGVACFCIHHHLSLSQQLCLCHCKNAEPVLLHFHCQLLQIQTFHIPNLSRPLPAYLVWHLPVFSAGRYRPACSSGSSDMLLGMIPSFAYQLFPFGSSCVPFVHTFVDQPVFPKYIFGVFPSWNPLAKFTRRQLIVPFRSQIAILWGGTLMPSSSRAPFLRRHTHMHTGVGVRGYFLVPLFTCVQLLRVYCLVKMFTKHAAYSSE